MKKNPIAFGAALALVAAFSFTSTPAKTESVVRCGPDRYYLSTGTLTETSLRQLKDGSFLLTDFDGNEARATCVNGAGCLGITGSASCSTTPNAPAASMVVNCPGGHSWRLSTPTDAGTCDGTFDSAGYSTGGACTEGESVSEADCTKNGGEGACTRTRNAHCDCVTCTPPEQESEPDGTSPDASPSSAG